MSVSFALCARLEYNYLDLNFCICYIEKLFISWKDSEERPLYCYFPQQRRRIYIFFNFLSPLFTMILVVVFLHVSLHFFFGHIWHLLHAIFPFYLHATCCNFLSIPISCSWGILHWRQTWFFFFGYVLFYIFLWMWPNIYSQSSKAAYGSLSKVAYRFIWRWQKPHELFFFFNYFAQENIWLKMTVWRKWLLHVFLYVLI